MSEQRERYLLLKDNEKTILFVHVTAVATERIDRF